MLLLLFKKDGAYLFIITKALESKPIYFKPPPYCNPTHAPTPLGSKPIRFRFQVLWVRMQSISFPKPAGIEANRLIPLGPNAIQFIIQSRWARMQSISFPKSAGIEPNRLVPLGPTTSKFIFQIYWVRMQPTSSPTSSPNTAGIEATRLFFWDRIQAKSSSRSVVVECNPNYIPNPLESKPVQFMFQICWDRSPPRET